MSEDILEIPIVDENGDCIFKRGDHYVIPLYQRAFAWGTGDNARHNEIIQLMDDIASSTGTYRLGSLIVARRGDKEYEVIDGQQRLTAFFLILAKLGCALEKGSLSYTCRPSAETVLDRIAQGTFSLNDGVPETDPAAGIVAGIRAIDQKIKAQSDKDKYKADLLERLESVQLCRIVVPAGTDLNRYFEIMNTRGEQLEPQDIVKARLMGALDDDAEKSAFATVWDACGDMDGYCQMHFHDMGQRKAIFGNDWSTPPPFTSGASLLQQIGDGNGQINGTGSGTPTFYDLVTSSQEKPQDENTDGQYSRYESVVDFRHFLLHALNVYLNPQKPTVSLDDIQLVEAFDNALKNAEGAKQFALGFIQCLLTCRYLFDRYVIKRVHDAAGKSAWSLHEMCAGSDDGPSYSRTQFSDSQSNNPENENVLMLESCLRVSYTDPKRMEWLTTLLGHLMTCNAVIASEVVDLLKDVVNEPIQSFLEGNQCMGVATPHIVFHYLDYLLWLRQDEFQKDFPDFAEGFAFEYRSSVEHWYPQTPPNGIIVDWVDYFGNLCILRGDINSKFSNLMPTSKQENREQYLHPGHQSLKLRLMAKLTEENKDWTEKICQTHGEMMLKVFTDSRTSREAGDVANGL